MLAGRGQELPGRAGELFVLDAGAVDILGSSGGSWPVTETIDGDPVIIAGYQEAMVSRNGKRDGPKVKRSSYLGVLPAIAIEVVGP